MKKKYIADYVKQYGHIPLTKDNFNELDAAVLNFLPLIQVEECIPPLGKEEKVLFKDVVKKHLQIYRSRKMGLLLKPHLYNLLVSASKQRRYSNLLVHSLFYEISEEKETQSIIFTIDIDQNTALFIFGGTDDTIIGWKENFNMMYIHHLPCLDNAYQYLLCEAQKVKQYFVIGHSKGGHMALYASLAMPKELQKKMIKTLVYDSPGYWPEELGKLSKDPEILKRCTLYCPQESAVGRMFLSPLTPVITKSTAKRLTQHDLTSWLINEDNHFVLSPHFNKISNDLAKEVQQVLITYDPLESQKFVFSLFKVASINKSKTLTELSKHYLQAVHAFIKLDKVEKRRISSLLKLLIEDGVLIEDLFPPLAKLLKSRKKTNEK